MPRLRRHPSRLAVKSSNWGHGYWPTRGSHSVSIRDTEHLGDAGIAASGGRRGNFDDNALADTITGLFRTEVIHDAGPWRSFDAAEYHAGPGRLVHHRAAAGTPGLTSNGAVRSAE